MSPAAPLALLRALVLALGLTGLGLLGRELTVGRPGDPLTLAGLPPSPLMRLPWALTEPEDERLARQLELFRPGSAELLGHLRATLPEDAVLLGFHATAAQTAEDVELELERASGLGFLGSLQLLLHPLPVKPMPDLGPGWEPPPGLPLDALYVLDVGYPDRALLEALLVPGPATAAGTLWLPRGEGAR